MSAWTVFYTAEAEQDLRSIYEYIAFSLLEPGTAEKQTVRILEAITGLSQLPLRHRLFEKEPWHSKGLRVMPIDSFLAFYLPNEADQTIAVVRIFYGGRDIESHLTTEE